MEGITLEETNIKLHSYEGNTPLKLKENLKRSLLSTAGESKASFSSQKIQEEILF